MSTLNNAIALPDFVRVLERLAGQHKPQHLKMVEAETFDDCINITYEIVETGAIHMITIVTEK